ncbi:iron chelate uptake ABC transporter family permease subunit [Sediminivirga luteola]|uniref:iron chelate uptake ABC transporter family permease subunit n=1 Tax=Sediminivirga luteola TaxID=1774748 RepID=UPI001F592A5E|nr:iron chelate uptake ABC transporter family permease subunit [Sediminivirga luteola]MCI2266767.1 iron chelate uptake ABC transporter family permease subunit [Sediminivirga luteola]
MTVQRDTEARASAEVPGAQRTTVRDHVATARDRTTRLSPAPRHSGPLTSRRHVRTYALVMTILTLLAAGLSIGIMTWNNPMPFGSEGYWLIAGMRRESLLTIAVVALCHATATIAFQTVVNNRIITPGIMGFGSLYTAIQTGVVYLFGVPAAAMLVGVVPFLVQTAAMLLLATILYTWLLSGRFSNVHIMLLVGVVIGGTLGSLSNFMQRMLTPSEFDVLTARLFGNISNARADYLPYAVPIALVVTGVLWLWAPRLNVLSLGKNTALNLGLNHKRELIKVLVLVSILIAMATALVGPMMFLGFLSAMLAYQFADTYSHRLLFPMGFLFGYTILAAAYFTLRHVWNAGGAVTIVVELVGGIVFLVFLLRKGRL